MRNACLDYEKRLGKYCSLELIELPDERAPERLSDKQRLQLLQRESERIEAALKSGRGIAGRGIVGRNIALAIEGMQHDSEGFAGYVAGLEMGGGVANFIIGGSLGLHPGLLQNCELISLSRLTFPHNMARLLLLEQLYRAMKINRNQVYHK